MSRVVAFRPRSNETSHSEIVLRELGGIAGRICVAAPFFCRAASTPTAEWLQYSPPGCRRAEAVFFYEMLDISTEVGIIAGVWSTEG